MCSEFFKMIPRRSKIPSGMSIISNAWEFVISKTFISFTAKHSGHISSSRDLLLVFRTNTIQGIVGHVDFSDRIGLAERARTCGRESPPPLSSLNARKSHFDSP
jgi:hypothetical protein